MQPFVVLGLALQHAGHDVRLLTTREFADFVNGFGLECAPLEGDIQGLLQSDEGQAVLTTRNPIKLAQGMRDLALPLMRRGTIDALAACDDADLLIQSGSGAWIGANIQDALQLPSILAYLQPLMPSGEHFSALMPQPPLALSRAINRLSSRMAFDGFWQVIRPPINELRRELFNMPPLPRLGLFDFYFERKYPVLLPFSRHVVPISSAFHENVCTSGYWFLNDADRYEPPAGLEAFLANGVPPVYFGFGSMASEDPAATTETVLKALEKTGQRGVILSGWGGLDASAMPDTVFHLKSTSHQWLFPKMAAIVHHGGAGTTAAALRSGVPSIVVPFFADQPFWARRVYDLGVGTKPIAKRRLTADKLAAAIESALSDKPMRYRARLLAEQLEAENGTQVAVQFVEKTIATWNHY